MAFGNGSFEQGDGDGCATQWTFACHSSREIAAFGTSPTETFDWFNPYLFTFGSSDLIDAIFNVDDVEESFELGWSNNESYAYAFEATAPVAALFDSPSENVEDFEEGWSSNESYKYAFVGPGTDLTVAAFDTVPENFEDFEEGWVVGYKTDFVGIPTDLAAATFQGPTTVETFEDASWETIDNAKLILPSGIASAQAFGTAVISSGLDRTTLALTGFWRNFSTSFPNAGTASAGGSANQDFHVSGSFQAPTAGSALNGHGTLDYDGTNDQSKLEGTTGDYINNNASSGWALVFLDTLDAAGANYYDDAGVVMDNSGTAGYQVSINSSGVRFGLYDGAYKATPYAALSTGAWQLIQWKHDGTNAKVRVNNGSWQSTAVGNIAGATLGGDFFASAGWQALSNSQALDGRLAELAITDIVLTDGQFDQIRADINTYYGISI